MEPSYESAVALACRAAGPLAGHLGLFVASLIDQQYAASVVHVKVRHAVSFDRWLAKHGVALADLGEIHIAQYQRRRRRRRRSIRAETRRREGYEVIALLGFLRTRGVCEAAQANSTPAEDLAAGFGQHLQDQQGLAAATIARYTTVARQFLTERGNVDLRALRAFEIIEFVQRQGRRMQAPAR